MGASENVYSEGTRIEVLHGDNNRTALGCVSYTCSWLGTALT